MKKIITFVFVVLLFVLSTNIIAQDKKDSEPDSLKNISLSGLSFRSIGPAITGGRVVALAINPMDHSEYFVGAGHGSIMENHEQRNNFLTNIR